MRARLYASACRGQGVGGVETTVGGGLGVDCAGVHLVHEGAQGACQAVRILISV